MPRQIKELEARVETLQIVKSEIHKNTHIIIEGIVEENSRLRTLLRSLGAFLGDGLNDPLREKTGWTVEKFQNFTSRADTDAAYEAFVKSKEGGSDVASSKDKATPSTKGDDDAGSARGNKRKRGEFYAEPTDEGPSTQRAYPGLELMGSNNALGLSSARHSLESNMGQITLDGYSRGPSIQDSDAALRKPALNASPDQGSDDNGS